jgi:hypothetical protein
MGWGECGQGRWREIWFRLTPEDTKPLRAEIAVDECILCTTQLQSAQFTKPGHCTAWRTVHKKGVLEQELEWEAVA